MSSPKKDLLRAYLAGWRKGAAFLAIEDGEANHPAFTKGWADGRAASRAAQAEAEAAYGVNLDMYRPVEVKPAPPAGATPGEGEGE